MPRQPLLGNLTTPQQPLLARIQNQGKSIPRRPRAERGLALWALHSTADAEQRDGSYATNLDQTLVSTLPDTKLQMEPEGIVLKCIPLLREMTRLRGLGLASKDSAKDDSPPKVNK